MEQQRTQTWWSSVQYFGEDEQLACSFIDQINKAIVMGTIPDSFAASFLTSHQPVCFVISQWQVCYGVPPAACFGVPFSIAVYSRQ
jgi:hypothetical protein